MLRCSASAPTWARDTHFGARNSDSGHAKFSRLARRQESVALLTLEMASPGCPNQSWFGTHVARARGSTVQSSRDDCEPTTLCTPRRWWGVERFPEGSKALY
eukprot:9488825-Pyramimonas_sp.AAC.2